MDTEGCDVGLLSECLGLQLSEIEMLSSMYPNESEFSVTLPHILIDMDRYISGKTEITPNELDFTMNLEVQDVNSKLEVDVTLPHNYPSSKPLVTARAMGLNRPQQKELNKAISEYINELPSGELCVISLINWLTENTKNFFSFQPSSDETETQDNTVSKDVLCRMWMYSHHIYSKFKRREIIDIAQDLNLTGFSLPGKPGFICIEGAKTDCFEFLQQLKHMSWKKMSLVKEEIVDSEEADINTFRKFECFQEISFQVRRGPAKEYHMDMGQFLKYLEEHECTYAFHDLFGLEGHVSNDK